MSTTQIDRLRDLLEPLATERGMDLEEITITPAGRRRVLRVVVDTDDGVGLEECAELSREVSRTLDETEVMGGTPYVLEVSSPGAERPLTQPRHYRRAVGRLIRANLHAGPVVTGRIEAVDDEGVDLLVPGPKGRRPTARRLTWDEIARARVEVEFNRPSAPSPRNDSQEEA